MRLNEEVADNEIAIPLRGLPVDSKYEIIKIKGSEFLKINEHSNELSEASNRIRYLNNRAWSVVYMVRKKY